MDGMEQQTTLRMSTIYTVEEYVFTEEESRNDVVNSESKISTGCAFDSPKRAQPWRFHYYIKSPIVKQWFHHQSTF
jgi:hypothetical protein